MRSRATPIEIPDRRPYIRLVAESGMAVTLRLPDLTEHATVIGRVTRAMADIVALTESMRDSVEEIGDADLERLDAAHTRLAAAYGHAVLRTWSDPDLELDARTRADEAKAKGDVYVSSSGRDGWEGMGLDAYRELVDAGYPVAGIVNELARQATAWLNDGKVHDEVRRKAKDFPPTS
jgi:hypothetical protein